MEQQQRVAVGGRFGNFRRTNGAAGAVDVFHHKVGTATHAFAHGFCQVTRDAVSRSTRCKRHHKSHRLGAGVGLRTGLRVGKYTGCGSGHNKQMFDRIHDTLLM